jgi:MinD-like ATPase involved in chromosome partitioning or flagellar assembly
MSKIISIHSFRGGTGKSNVTANLAAQAALAGKRAAIVDSDIQSPGIHVLFGLDDNSMKQTLNDYLHGQCAITDAALPVGREAGALAGVRQLADKHLWLVPSSINTGEISRVLRDGYDVNILNKGLKTLRRDLQLDYLFIDTHPGLNEETLLSIGISDNMVIILRPDQQDFQGTAVTLDVARSLDVPNISLLVNKALTSKYDPNQIRAFTEETFQASVAGVLPLSEDMVDMGSADLFSLRYPDHPWSKELARAAQTILGLS